jgi:hypothetical protein
MPQATLDDDDLFDEAASEMCEDVESSLEQARRSLPAPAEIWDVGSDNTLGVLNTLRSALDTGDAGEHLRDAKKWYAMGSKADAFDDPEELATEIERTEELITDVESAHDRIDDLTGTIPQLRTALQDADSEGETGDADTAEV